jgi:hypothetical protein
MSQKTSEIEVHSIEMPYVIVPFEGHHQRKENYWKSWIILLLHKMRWMVQTSFLQIII